MPDLKELDRAILECSGIRQEHMKKIQEDESWNHNRICFLKICVQHLWINDIRSDANMYTQLIHKTMKKYISCGLIV